MQTYDEALARVLSAADPLPAESVSLADAAGRALAAPIVAPENLPGFDNSAVDGYAVDDAGYEFHEGTQYFEGKSIHAGEVPAAPVRAGEAFYVATGAVVPEGTTGIVMVEDTWQDNQTIGILAEPSLRFIRRAGSDVTRGETILRPGDRVTPGAVGLLAALGVARVSCHARPRVGILSTGNELVPVSTRTLPPAKIRDSNRHALAAAVVEAGGIVEASLHALDDENALHEAFQSLAGCDVIVSSGGVSVGAADFVKKIVEALGTLDFWRVAIKPGKPLAFGRVGEALFFGLPGNPVSSLVTFELFVRPALRRLSGHAGVGRPRLSVTLAEPLAHEPGRREFIRARIEYRGDAAFATPTGAQGSHRLSSLVGADALLIAHEDRGDYAAGEAIPALLLT